MTSKDFTEQGVSALKEGDKSRAHDLLRQAVELDPENAKAWFFLSRTQSSSEEKRQSLEKVLELMPNNKPAQEALENLDSQEEDFSEFEDGDAFASSTSSTGGAAVKPKIAGITLPVAIPDAPEQVEPQTIIQEFIETFKNGIEILRRTPSVYPMEIQRATWWRFWQYVVIAWIISGIAGAIASAITQAQLAALFNDNALLQEIYQSPSIIAILLTAIITIPLGIIALYAGLYASHRWVTSSRNGQGSFVAHSYTVMLPSVTVSIISNVGGLLFAFIPVVGGLLAIVFAILSIYALYIAGQGLAIVHKVDNKTGYWTVAVMIVVQFVTGFIAGIVLSPIILTSGMAFM